MVPNPDRPDAIDMVHRLKSFSGRFFFLLSGEILMSDLHSNSPAGTYELANSVGQVTA